MRLRRDTILKMVVQANLGLEELPLWGLHTSEKHDETELLRTGKLRKMGKDELVAYVGQSMVRVSQVRINRLDVKAVLLLASIVQERKLR